jgi:hypothetical protein
MNQKDFESSLQKGQEVRLRWRGKFALATVFRVNKSSISVVTREVLEDIPVGARVVVDRAVSGRRSANNCVRPLD